ncbi:MAG TPA: diaminopropionate ammonia-lyase, partial [Ktedonobacterales bacterium]|nr:diaminopropionate ammonia-lyase [Ktedonobacterales bacterium]
LGASWATYRALMARLDAAPALWATQDELRERVRPLLPLTLTTATDGNHGRAVAHMAALLGLDAQIFVPAGTAAARIEGIEGEGATVTVVDGTYDDAVARAARRASERCLVISDTSWPGYEDIPRWVIEGYSTIFAEVDEQLAQANERGPDLVVAQMGVGALAAAVVQHYRRPGIQPPVRIIGVEPAHSACVLASMEAGRLVTMPGPHDSIMAGLNCGTPSAVAWPLLANGIDTFAAIDDEWAIAAMRALATEGIVAGETGAAGLAGLLALLTDPASINAPEQLGITASTHALVLCTEGATDPVAYQRLVSGS